MSAVRCTEILMPTCCVCVCVCVYRARCQFRANRASLTTVQRPILTTPRSLLKLSVGAGDGAHVKATSMLKDPCTRCGQPMWCRLCGLRLPSPSGRAAAPAGPASLVPVPPRPKATAEACSSPTEMPVPTEMPAPTSPVPLCPLCNGPKTDGAERRWVPDSSDAACEYYKRDAEPSSRDRSTVGARSKAASRVSALVSADHDCPHAWNPNCRTSWRSNVRAAVAVQVENAAPASANARPEPAAVSSRHGPCSARSHPCATCGDSPATLLCSTCLRTFCDDLCYRAHECFPEATAEARVTGAPVTRAPEAAASQTPAEFHVDFF